MKRLFGTDGIRGIVGEGLTAELAFSVGRATGQVLCLGRTARPHALIGTDTRASGGMLSAALAAGLTAAGVDVTLLGVLPTPGVASLVLSRRADAGVVVSASHNSYEYNGIKIFGADGYKLPDALEEEIEALVGTPMATTLSRSPGSDSCITMPIRRANTSMRSAARSMSISRVFLWQSTAPAVPPAVRRSLFSRALG